LQAHAHAAQLRQFRTQAFGAADEQRVFDVIDAVARLAHDALQLVGLVTQQVVEQRRRAGHRLAALDRRAQPIDRAQRAPACGDDQLGARADPQRGHVAGLESEVVGQVVQHCEHRVAQAFDARRA
jgi:hypothetical protein